MAIKNNLKLKLKPWLSFGIPLILAALMKGLVSSPAVTPFNADEAIVGLMARHINQGQLPIFFYGQYYMGSLDAMLLAILFRILGESVWVIRLLQGLLYLGTVFTTALLGKRLLGSFLAAFLAGLIAAVPPLNVTLYSTVSLGGYGEVLLMGNLLLLGGISILDQTSERDFQPTRGYFLGLLIWGLGAGFAFWVFGLSLVYTMPVVLLLFWTLRRAKTSLLFSCGTTLLMGALIGAAPWWFAAIDAGNGQILTELTGGAIANINQGLPLLRPLNRIANLIIFGGTVITGLRPPWSVNWLMLPMLPLALVFWLVVLLFSIKKLISAASLKLWLPCLVGLVLTVGFIFTPYGDDPSGRYFLPLILPMAIFAADLIQNEMAKRAWIGYGLIVFLLIFNLGGTLQARAANPPGITTQFDQDTQIDQKYTDQLLVFLESIDVQRGYSNYWVSYPVAFLSGEKIVLSPRLPYHHDFRYTERDDRYPLYTELVRSADKIVYITTLFPDLNSFLREEFSAAGITWNEKQIGDYTVFYELSAPIQPEQIELGRTTHP